MTYPASASLLTALDTSYDQDPYSVGNRRCGSFGFAKPIEIGRDRDPRFAGTRVSRDFLFSKARWFEGTHQSPTRGANPASYARALDMFGICSAADYSDNGDQTQIPPQSAHDAAAARMPIRAYTMPYLRSDTTGIKSIKHWICEGYAIAAAVYVHQGLRDTQGDVNTHAWDSSGPWMDEHITCFAEYTPERIIASDSGTGHYGDSRGRVGWTYDKFEPGPQRAVQSLWIVDELAVMPKRVEGYMPEPATFSASEIAALKVVEVAKWVAMAAQVPNADLSSHQGIINAAYAAGLKDRHVEMIFGMGRGDLKPHMRANGLTAPDDFFEGL